MEKALAHFEIKSVDEDQRVLRGVASTPRIDRVSDSIDPLGITFAKTVPLLAGHDHTRPIGTVRFDKPTADGLSFEARIPKVLEPGPLKDRVDTAWYEAKYGLVTDVSIGFRPLPDEVEPLPNGGIRFKKVEVIELSLCAVGANPDAKILEVRSQHQAKPKCRVVKITPADVTRAKILVEAERREERRKRLGIDLHRVVRLRD